jgi:prephenate dehydrogenase
MAKNFLIDKLVIIGVGLIGGSFALALKEDGAVREVVGVGRTRKNLQLALQKGVVDAVEIDLGRAVAGADMVLVGAPVGQMPGIFRALAAVIDDRAIITDAGSTKQDVIAAAKRHLGRHFERFVPAHPIAGTEHSGAGAAFPSLFRGRNLILVDQPRAKTAAVRRVHAAWKACGANVVRMASAEHDAIFGAVSHLPHVVAFSLVSMLAKRPSARRMLGFSGGGLRDTVRIAGSSPEMWRDICIANRKALLPLIDAYQRELAAARRALANADGDRLERLFTQARDARGRWLAKR